MATQSTERGFRAFLERRRAATVAFFSGDPGPWKAMAARGSDVTMFGGYGGHEVGREAVEDRYTWAAARNAAGVIAIEMIACHVTPEMACTVAIERGEVRPRDGAAFAPKALRVTEVFRREDGEWRLVHRHADPLVAVER